MARYQIRVIEHAIRSNAEFDISTLFDRVSFLTPISVVLQYRIKSTPSCWSDSENKDQFKVSYSTSSQIVKVEYL